MSIYPEKRKGLATGRLVVEVQRNHKTIKKFADNRKAAVRLEAEIKAGFHDNPTAPKSDVTHGDLTLIEFGKKASKLWDEDRDRKQSVARLEGFLSAVAVILEKHKLPLTLKAVKSQHLTETADWLQAEKGLKSATLNRYISAGSKAFKWALLQNYIDGVPAFPWKSVEQPEVFYLTEDAETKQVKALEEHGHDDVLTIMKAQLASGCRINELLRLKPAMIRDDDDGFFSLHLGRTKNGLERVACIPDDLGRAFLKLVEAGLPTYRSVWRRLKKARERAGLPLTQPTHAHRHTTATRLAADSENSFVIADVMGHQSLETTRRYTHNDLKTKKSAVKRMLTKRMSNVGADATG